MTVTDGTALAATYQGTRTALAAAAEFVELFADIEIDDLHAYGQDGDGSYLTVTLTDETNQDAQRIADILGLTGGNQAVGFYDGYLGGFWGGVWVSVNLFPTEEPTPAQRFWGRNRSRVIALGLVASGVAAALAARRIARMTR